MIYGESFVRLLFFNEGNLGTFILGQDQVEANLRTAIEHLDGAEARFARLTEQGRWAHAAATWTRPLLSRESLDAKTLRWHAVQSTRARRQVRAEVEAFRPDILHLHSHSIALGLGGVMRRVPTALSVDVTIRDWRMMPAWRPKRPWASAELVPVCAAERRRFRQAALVLAWTPWAAASVLAACPEARVVEHHPGIDLERFSPGTRREPELPRVLFIGGRFEDKGGGRLLDALSDDLGRTVELDLVTPADVPSRPGIRIHRLGPQDPELLELRRQAALFCLPSTADAAPWAVLEAMACGIPTVASDVGGIPDLLGHGEAGVVVAHDDVRALGTAIRSLLADPTRRQALGQAARRRCEAHYDARRQAAQLVDLLAPLRAATP